MVPLHFFETFNEDGSALDVFASWLPSDGVGVVRKGPADLAGLDHWVSELVHSLLRIFNVLEHHKSVVKLLEKRPKIKLV